MMRRIDQALSVRGGRLYVEDVDCVALTERFGTPLYVVSEDQLRRNARSFRQAFASHWQEGQVRILPSLKANYAFALRHVLSQEGMGCDTFGPSELHAAVRSRGWRVADELAPYAREEQERIRLSKSSAYSARRSRPVSSSLTYGASSGIDASWTWWTASQSGSSDGMSTFEPRTTSSGSGSKGSSIVIAFACGHSLSHRRLIGRAVEAI